MLSSRAAFASLPPLSLPPPSIHHPIHVPPPPPPPAPSPSRPIPRSPYVNVSTQRLVRLDSQQSTSSALPPPLHDVLAEGDYVGHGLSLQGQLIRPVSHPATPPTRPQAFEVVGKLGSGSYAVVFLVREVLSPIPRPQDDLTHLPFADDLDLDLDIPKSPIKYGKEFAIKVLSKANLNPDALDAQLFEATVHQSLPVHPNIVTLHSTLQTDSYLLLVLECVPGEDLFYFLEQSRDHSHDEPFPDDPHAHVPSATPPTPSLLSALHPAQLLSQNRLRLIASMFSQMCDAVAACHSVGVFHRDIKPENFIVTDGWVEGERKVVVKLTDFGLATEDAESADMECGSAPYMSYECRNNCAPTYATGPADVWSLGIVLINMLYHHNPWSDTSDCSSFEAFRAQPISFFVARFPGMTRPVAEFLATRVFCVLDESPPGKRVSAAEFGRWIRGLPTYLSQGATPAPSRLTPISPSPRSRRPGSRSRPPSRGPESRPESPRGFELAEPDLPEADEQENDVLEPETAEDVEACSRTTSTARRRKRGARKGRGVARQRDVVEDLAAASQILVREISKTSRTSSKKAASPPRGGSSPPPVPVPNPVKKQRGWKGVFRMASSDSVDTVSHAHAGHPSSPVVPDLPSVEVESERSHAEPSATATNVSTLIMGLSPAPRERERDADTDRGWRGRPRWQQSESERGASPGVNSSNWRTASSSASSISGASSSFTRFSNGSVRSVSTVATSVSGVGVGSAGDNWRQPQVQDKDLEREIPQSSSANTAKIGKSSLSPFSTVTKQKPPPPLPPSNLKFMSGVPLELHELPLPRACNVRPNEYVFAPPSLRHTMKAQSKTLALDPINERVPVEKDDGAGGWDRDREREDDDVPRKVQKGQINALAKMLSHLKTNRGAH